nr:hypothetical protein [Tanacetum cinerariifolium]
VQARGLDNILTTQEYVRKITEDVSEDDHFMQGPWLQAIAYLYGEGVIVSGCLSDMKKHFIKGKLKLVVGVVKSCTPNSLRDMTVTIKDPTGTMGSTIHYKVFQNEDGGYAKSIKVGFVLILRNVSVWTPKPSQHYLNITIRNIVKGACVFADKWSLDELTYRVPRDGPYQTNPPSPDDIILYIQNDREEGWYSLHGEQYGVCFCMDIHVLVQILDLIVAGLGAFQDLYDQSVCKRLMLCVTTMEGLMMLQKEYIEGEICFVDMINREDFKDDILISIMQSLGYVQKHKVMHVYVELVEKDEEHDSDIDFDSDTESENEIVDEEHVVDEVEVNMNNFKFQIDEEDESSDNDAIVPNVNVTEDNLEVLDFGLLESDLEDVTENARSLGLRKLKKNIHPSSSL